MKNLKYLMAALLLTSIGVSSAQAAFIINIYNPDNLTTALATLSGTGSVGDVLGFTGVNVTSSTEAYAFAVNSSEATETAFMNSLTNNNPIVTFAGKDESGTNSFEITQRYFSVKFGNYNNGNGGTAFFEIMSNSSIELTFNKIDNNSGLSHVTQYSSPVPLPAAAWLFGSALMGVAGIGYRRKTQEA